jgi:DNA replication protein DnaC
MRVKGHRVRLTQAHVELMQIPRRFWASSVELIPESIRPLVLGYCRDLDSRMDLGQGLLLQGPNGVGKTSAACFVAMEARRRGATVLFLTAEGLRSSGLDRVEFRPGQSMHDRARTVDMLVLDDLGKEYSSTAGHIERVLEQLIRDRSAAVRTTILTTNMKSDQLQKRYKPSMLAVLSECAASVIVTGPSQREAPDLAKTG